MLIATVAIFALTACAVYYTGLRVLRMHEEAQACHRRLTRIVRVTPHERAAAFVTNKVGVN